MSAVTEHEVVAEHEVLAEREVMAEHEVIDRPILDPALAPPFPVAALPVLRNLQLRRNVAHAIDVIQAKRARLVAEKPDWQELRSAASRIRDEALQDLGAYLEQFEAVCTAAGGTVHWALDAADARRIILKILREEKADEVIKIKTMTSAEIQLNPFLEANGVRTYETDLAEIILQLGEGEPSHIVVPALHVNRSQVREIFARRMGIENLSDEPEALTAAARNYLRQKFLSVPTAISGANFLIAETGSVAVVESEGNGRMCLTLPRTMITLAGIEKVLPRFADLEVMLQLLARSATGERMNPYTSLWTGVTPGDGPQKFHVVLLDNGRSSILARKTERQTLRCIRCAACMNACPVYRQTGGHAYGSVYPGPIGAILTPQLEQMRHAQSLPFASSLCGACFEVCPVKINIPEVLLELRARVTDQERKQVLRFFDPLYLGLRAANLIFSRAWLFHAAQHMGRIALRLFTRKDGWIHALPGIGAKWTQTRDLRGLPEQTFHEWWAKSREQGSEGARDQGTKGARERGSEGAREQGSEGTRERGSKGARGQGNEGPREQRGGGTMSTSSSREAILGRIRAAAGSPAATAEEDAQRYGRVSRDYQVRGELTVRACQELFMERLREYDAKVVECAPEELGATIAAQIEASGKRRFIAPSGVPNAWLVTAAWQITGFECDIDHGLTATEIEKAEGVMTACFCGVADSGTIVLHHSATEGRRVITLLPDWHLCIVRASQIVETLPEYFDRCGNAGTEGPRDQGNEKARTKGQREDGGKALPRLVTWISGPSATADIEMTRIKGVHGPRFLNVIVVNDGEQGIGNRE